MYFKRRSEPLLPSIGNAAPTRDDLARTRVEHWQPDTGFDPQTQRSILLVLMQVLAPLGIKFKFSIERHPSARADDMFVPGESTVLQTPDWLCPPLEYRLWVQCHSYNSQTHYQLIAEPLATALRQLDLQIFQAAIVECWPASTPIGTADSDWRLKIDLAPPTVLLKNWARWGDVQAIVELLNLALAPSNIGARATLKNYDLQIRCVAHAPLAPAPERQFVLNAIAPLLIALSPQGIRTASIEGSQPAQTAPAWRERIVLPAADDPHFEIPALMLAARGERTALKFVLERLLNPELERCLTAGFISLSLTYRQQLLHVMSEAVTCPLRSHVATTVIKVLQQLAIAGIGGVRVYGRSAGQSLPIWTDGIDFRAPQLILPPAPSAPPAPPVEPVVPIVELKRGLGDTLAGTGIWTHKLVMTSPDRLVYHRRFQWGRSLALMLCGLGLTVGADYAIRFALHTKQIATQPADTGSQLSFNNPLLEQQFRQYQLRCDRDGAPDILIVGSSRALRGVDPAVLQSRLGKRGDRPVTIYNFGINGATAQVVDLVLRQILTPQQLPKLVIWADGARAFNSGRTDRTYETIVASERYQHLISLAGKQERESSILQVQSSVKNTYQAIDGWFDAEFAQRSHAYNRRELLKTWLQSQVNKASQALESSKHIDNSTIASDGGVDLNGFLAIDVRFDPTTYYDRYARVSGDSDGDYLNFQLTGDQEQAFQQVTKLLAQRQIPLIFVNTPLSDIYLDKVRRQHEATFRDYLHKSMAAGQLTFIDLSKSFTKRYELFSDPSHLNQFGAIAVSRYLARPTVLPWQKLLDRQTN